MSEIEDKVKQAPISYYIGVGVLIALVYYMNYYDGGSKIERKITTVKTELKTVTKELNDIEALTNNYKKYQEDLNLLSSKYEQALNYLPSRENIYVIIKQLYTEAKLAGVNITLVKPGDNNVKQEFYEEMPMTIKVEGSFSQVLMFLSKVVNLPRIINLTDVSLTSPEKISSFPIVKLEGNMVAYRYLEGEKKK